jgi:hypothetical protein
MLRDRRVLACLLVAVLLAVLNALWDPVAHVMAGDFGDSAFWLWRLIWIAPFAIALVAVVSSGRPGSGVLVAAAALVAALVAVEIDTGIGDLAAGISLVGVLAYFLNVVALVPVDLMAAARRQVFDTVSGAVAGLVCGAVLATVAFLWGLPRITEVPAWYVLSGYVFPPAALAAVGAVTGLVAGGVSGRRRSLADG